VPCVGTPCPSEPSASSPGGRKRNAFRAAAALAVSANMLGMFTHDVRRVLRVVSLNSSCDEATLAGVSASRNSHALGSQSAKSDGSVSRWFHRDMDPAVRGRLPMASAWCHSGLG
jgi:hypothetical protein